jgi:nicotinamide mononucleotide transporter
VENKTQKKFTGKDIFIFVLMGITAVGITVSGIYTKQAVLNILPLYVSLVIGMLQSRVNRFASLLGSANSILYGVVYIWYKLYGSGVSALLFSCPIQLLTFIRWNKNKSGESTVLRKLTWRQRIIMVVGYVLLLVALWIILPLLGSEYVFLDSATTLLGILIYFLTMFAYIEYPVLMIVNGIINIALYVTMLKCVI